MEVEIDRESESQEPIDCDGRQPSPDHVRLLVTSRDTVN